MAMYLCRWPNGEFSIVSAATKDDAIVLLDEWGNAEQASLKRMADCMFDFRLRDDGEIELADIGGATQDFIMQTCYPVLANASSEAESNDDESDLSSTGQQQIREAVELERTRLWKDQPRAKEAETELGRDIQKQTGAPSVFVDRIVRQAATKRLHSMPGGRNQIDASDGRVLWLRRFVCAARQIGGARISGPLIE
jgi:hypothetical protein